MNEALDRMLQKYPLQSRDDFIGALREILQQIALLGLWRGKFFERAAFYGGTALRLLYGLERFSEDLDFSLLEPDPNFSLTDYGEFLRRELLSFGFEVSFESRPKYEDSAIKSAFLKANTLQNFILIKAGKDLTRQLQRDEVLKIKLEVDTDPPGGFATEMRAVLLPIPFMVRVYVRPDLFAGKMHAVLCRRWKTRVKGRDWYDLLWYLAHHPQLRLSHLESRMRYSGDWTEAGGLTRGHLLERFEATLENIDLAGAKKEVARYLRCPESLEVWSKPFFLDIIQAIKTI